MPQTVNYNLVFQVSNNQIMILGRDDANTSILDRSEVFVTPDGTQPGGWAILNGSNDERVVLHRRDVLQIAVGEKVASSANFQVTDITYTVTFRWQTGDSTLKSPFGDTTTFSGTYSANTLTLQPLPSATDTSGTVKVNWYLLTLGRVPPAARQATFEFKIEGTVTVNGVQLPFSHDPEVDIGTDTPPVGETLEEGAAAASAG